mgnify:CR=1 FL=1
MELTSKQRAQLRGLASTLDTIIHIGKDGISDNLVKQADDALEARSWLRARCWRIPCSLRGRLPRS